MTIRNLPPTFQNAVQQLVTRPDSERESFQGNAVDSLALLEFEATDAAVRKWDGIPEDREPSTGAVNVQVRDREYRGASAGSRWDGESSSVVTTESGAAGTFVRLTPESTDVFRMKEDPVTGEVSGCRMHHDRVTGEAWILRL